MTTDDNNDASNHERTTPGRGVTIRATELSDAQAIADLRHQPLVVRYSLALPHRSRETVEAWLARCASRRNGSLDLCALVDGRVVGHGGIEVGAPRRAHGASLGINVHDAYSGRGVGTALMAALVGRADRALGLRRIELTVFADNARAIALYRRFGFAEEGRSRGYASRDGALMDVLHMARLADAPAFAAQAD
ncbi:GNAT family N-acetyltransferase [Burkholderia alba]|uniref:GNAT family N-acetyltransferase n=1 Tax=Burkholderia alba TaxID=2683677 RepID=UPI002B055F24|nr:GNAT family N-acetyltransferase [Burkholderia alba]